MNANRSFRFYGLLALALLAMSLAQTSASAQGFKASFTLPVATRWGLATLPAGKYFVTVDSQAFPSIAVIEGEGVHVLVMASVIDGGAATGPSKLVIARSGGRARVCSLYVETFGLTFRYPPPKSGWLVAQTPELIERLPVTLGGK